MSASIDRQTQENSQKNPQLLVQNQIRTATYRCKAEEKNHIYKDLPEVRCVDSIFSCEVPPKNHQKFEFDDFEQ